MRSIAFLLALFLLFAIGLGILTGLPAESSGHLLAGWLHFLGRTCSQATVNWSGVATLALCGALLLASGHRFAVWLASAIQTQSSSTNVKAEAGDQLHGRVAGRWPLRRTALLLAIVVLMFVAGISFIGLVHQTAWLATTPEPLTVRRLRLAAVQETPAFNFRVIGDGLGNFARAYGQTAPNGAWPARREAVHSWQTRMLSFMSVQPRQYINMRIDWDDPQNVPAFQRLVVFYLSPDFDVLREHRGFGVSHYAGNERFFAEPVSLERVKNAGNALIVCGEVSHDFMGWGDPANVRDPTLGLNRAAAGFGSANEQGVNFLMADGSTRCLSNDIDPRVLATLASPQRIDVPSRSASTGAE
jgi:hypothetical protein